MKKLKWNFERWKWKLDKIVGASKVFSFLFFFLFSLNELGRPCAGVQRREPDSRDRWSRVLKTVWSQLMWRSKIGRCHDAPDWKWMIGYSIWFFKAFLVLLVRVFWFFWSPSIFNSTKFDRVHFLTTTRCRILDFQSQQWESLTYLKSYGQCLDI